MVASTRSISVHCFEGRKGNCQPRLRHYAHRAWWYWYNHGQWLVHPWTNWYWNSSRPACNTSIWFPTLGHVADRFWYNCKMKEPWTGLRSDLEKLGILKIESFKWVLNLSPFIVFMVILWTCNLIYNSKIWKRCFLLLSHWSCFVPQVKF